MRGKDEESQPVGRRWGSGVIMTAKSSGSRPSTLTSVQSRPPSRKGLRKVKVERRKGGETRNLRELDVGFCISQLVSLHEPGEMAGSKG